VVPATPAPVGRRPAANGPKATMIGLPGNPVRRDSAAPAAPAPMVEGEKKAVPLKTMMGMTSPFMPGPPPPARDSVVPPARGSTEGELNKPPPQRTMMGVAPPPALAQAIREANAAREAQARESTPGEPSVGAPAESSPFARESSAKLPAAGSGQAAAKRTMLGFAMTPPAPADAKAAAAPSVEAKTPDPAVPARPSAPERKVSPKSDRTMLGIAASKPADGSAPRSEEAPLTFTQPELPGDVDEDTRDSFEESAPRGGARPWIAAVAGALFVLLAFGALWFALADGSDLRVQVAQGEEGEQLVVEVPSAPPGAKVRFLGAEQELRGGVARFALSADALALGDNELTIGLVQGNDVESEKVRLHVAYRARVDLAGLSRDPPTLDVVIDAIPGSKATVDGQPLALDARGHGVKSYPIAPQTGSKLAFNARYRIEPKDGPASEGALVLSLPVTSLQIDRPGPSVTTDQSSLEVAGAVEAGAEVLVDGKPVRVNEGRFLHRVPLAKPGDYTIRVLARGQSKAPRAIEVQIKRVADLALAAASFKPDAELTYGRIAQNPVIYRGQNVAFDGRVYNVEVKGGGSHLQMLVRDCPGSQRCPLWVDLPQDTDVTVDTWVRVLGTVAGEQQFRSEKGQVHTVPSVRAQYVLKLAR
jgi:hypothetical protein